VVPENSGHPNSVAAWRKWLSTNHRREAGVCLIMWDKDSGHERLDYGRLLEEALCFAWIDSKPAKLDEHRSMPWFAPRKAATGWSRLNKQRVETAMKVGKMSPMGLTKTKAAKKDGSWHALDHVEMLELPDDLAAALTRVPAGCCQLRSISAFAQAQHCGMDRKR